MDKVILNSDVPTNPATLTGSKVWASPAWRALALAWVDEHLGAAGITRTGPVGEARVRSWSTVFSVPTTVGRVWFKAAGPATAFEVPLYEILRQLAPAHVLTPIAADSSRGWILLPDGGRPLADCFTGPERADALVAVLARYGQMQRDLASRVPDLLAIGVPDMRPAAMPRRFNEALKTARYYVERAGGESERASYDAVAGLRDTFTAWCEQLASSPVTPTLDHCDLHPKNILVTEAGLRGQVRFFDWGTSVIAHPFTSMLIPLRFVLRNLRVTSDDPAIERARDAYLDAFRDLAPHAELVTTLEVACRLGMVVRSLVAVSLAGDGGAPGPGKQQTAFEWLTSLLEDSYLGRVDRTGRARALNTRFDTPSHASVDSVRPSRRALPPGRDGRREHRRGDARTS